MGRILVSWIGAEDMRNMAWDLSAAEKKKVHREISREHQETEEPRRPGPVKTLLDQEQFDEIHLLCNYAPWAAKKYVRWLECTAEFHQVKLKTPTDYEMIFKEAERLLEEITRPAPEQQLCILLSPGTPAMAAVWILLGRSRFQAEFWQAHAGKARVEEVPVDLVLDFLPRIYRDADAGLREMAGRSPRDVTGFEDIVGESPALKRAVQLAETASTREFNVLLTGESGTGKELFAQAIHACGPRKKEEMITINCAAIPILLNESELFGHVKGAFTDAISEKTGAFEAADGSTLFLDEIGELSLEAQASLLRVLQPAKRKGPCHREFSRVGSTKPVFSNVRIIAATNQNLVELISQNRFRDDLYYRLAQLTLKMPPLRDRKNDIPALVGDLLTEINGDCRFTEPGYVDKTLSRAALAFARRQHWAGNVRQLSSTLRQAAVFCGDEVKIGPGDLAAALAESAEVAPENVLDRALGDGFSLPELLDEVQAHYLKRAVSDARGIKKDVANLLGIKSYQTLDYQLKKYGIDSSRR